MRAQAGIPLQPLSTRPGLSPSTSRHLLHRCCGQIPSEGAHIHNQDLGQGSGTGVSPAPSPGSAAWGSAPKWQLCSPCARENLRENLLTSKKAERLHTRRDEGEARREDGCIVQQKGEISCFWIYRGFDLTKRRLNQINTINIYE